MSNTNKGKTTQHFIFCLHNVKFLSLSFLSIINGIYVILVMKLLGTMFHKYLMWLCSIVQKI
jgi:hypothetical protein